MRESIGSSWIFLIVISFTLIFAGFLVMALSYSKTYKIKNGVYVKTLSNYDIESSKKEAKQNGYKYYENITTNTPWYFYNRETGGYMTGAYMDGRNKAYPKNDYYNSNMGIESYLLELGYINCKNDFKK